MLPQVNSSISWAMPPKSPSGVTRGLREIAQGAVVTLGAVAVGRLIALALQATLGRGLGPEQFGRFTLVLTLMTMGARLGVLGIDASLPRFVAKLRAEGDLPGVRGATLSALFVSGGFAAIVALVVFLASELLATQVFHDSQLESVIRVQALLLPLLAITWVLIATLRGLKHIVALSLVREIVVPGLRLTGVFVGLGIGLEPVLASWVYVIAGVIGITIGLRLVHRGWLTIAGSHSSGARPMGQELLRFSWPLIPAQQLAAVRNRGDMLVLGVFAAASEVGLYGAAAVLARLIPVPLFALNRLFLPVLAEASERGRHEVAYLYRVTARWGLMASGPLFLVLFFLAAPVVNLVYGPEFNGAAPALRWLSVGMLMNAASGPFGEAFIALGVPRRSLAVSVVGTVSAIGFYLLLIPRLGFVGAAIASSMALVLAALSGVVLLWHHNRVFPIDSLYLRALAVLVVVGGVAAMLPGEPTSVARFFGASIGLGLASATGFVIFGALPVRELRLIQSMRGRN